MMDSEIDEDDFELVERAMFGETRAFDALMLRHGERLYGLIYNLTSHHEDTNDIMQDVFHKAYVSLKKFHGRSSFFTWLYTIAINTTMNHLKKQNRRSGLSLSELSESALEDPALVDMSNHSNPIQKHELKELQKRLNVAMQELSNEHRTVVTLFDIQGLSQSEISQILKISEGTVKSRLFYAHQQLQSKLQDVWLNKI